MNPQADPFADPFQELEDSLAEGIAAVIAASDELEATEPDLAEREDMADLFLDELNRLWADPAPLALS